MIIEHIDISKLNAAAYNPRRNLRTGDAAYDHLAKSIEAFGYVDPIIWNSRTGNIVGGHQRLKVLIDRGERQVQCSVVNLDDANEKALNLALNKIAGDWDFTKLTDVLTELDAASFDMELTGFVEDELKRLMSWTPEALPEDKSEPASGVDKNQCPKCGYRW